MDESPLILSSNWSFFAPFSVTHSQSTSIWFWVISSRIRHSRSDWVENEGEISDVTAHADRKRSRDVSVSAVRIHWSEECVGYGDVHRVLRIGLRAGSLEDCKRLHFPSFCFFCEFYRWSRSWDCDSCLGWKSDHMWQISIWDRRGSVPAEQIRWIDRAMSWWHHGYSREVLLSRLKFNLISGDSLSSFFPTDSRRSADRLIWSIWTHARNLFVRNMTSSSTAGFSPCQESSSSTTCCGKEKWKKSSFAVKVEKAILLLLPLPLLLLSLPLLLPLLLSLPLLLPLLLLPLPLSLPRHWAFQNPPSSMETSWQISSTTYGVTQEQSAASSPSGTVSVSSGIAECITHPKGNMRPIKVSRSQRRFRIY